MSADLASDSVRALAAELRRRSAGDPALAPFAARLDQVDCSSARFDRPRPCTHAMMAQLGPALDAAAGEPRLLAATRAVAGAVNWYQVYRGEGIDPGLAEGMLGGQIAGQVGILASDTLRTGLFLLAPGIHYPLHTHGAAELYYCMSGRLALQHGTAGTPFELRPGDCSVTPTHRLHSLDTGAGPVLLLYVWIGDVDSPNWWWERRPEGGWRRVNWSRTPDGS
ncbi:MAG: dimethylsulfonioproprionate lyase family protein, partial [Paracoccaceae bacterium]